jgi:putative ABC transport system permease protein
MILRHTWRWPVRSALTALGIAMGVAVLFTSLQWMDSIERLIQTSFFVAQRQTAAVTLVEPQTDKVMAEFNRLPGVLSAEPFRIAAVRFRVGHIERRGSITGVLPDADLSLVLDRQDHPVRVPEVGIVLSSKLAELIGAGRGDVLTVEVTEGRRPVLELPVTAIFETYLGTPAYMHIGALNRALGEGHLVSGANLLVDSRREAELYRTLKHTPALAAVNIRRAAIDTFNETMAETMNIMIGFYVMFASLLAIGVVYNSVRISLSERGRELASLRVMGFTRGETSYILLGELAILTILALPLGCAFGYGLSWYISQAMENELYRVPLAPVPSTYGYAVAVVALAALLSGLLVRRRIDRLDLIAVLKTRE